MQIKTWIPFLLEKSRVALAQVFNLESFNVELNIQRKSSKNDYLLFLFLGLNFTLSQEN